MDSRGRFVQLACEWEVRARKPGNVHPEASFTGTRAQHFLESAAAIREPLTSGLTVGEAILAAVRATKNAVGQNTNLGIILLLAPLAAAPLREGVRGILSTLTIADAEATFRAIRLAAPGGLGDAAEQDVQSAPTVTLLEAMALAADRDRIARQYTTGFEDVFEFGVPHLAAGFDRFQSVEAAIIDTHLAWLAAAPDSLIVRKNGPAVAEDVRRRAEAVQDLGGIGTETGLRAVQAFDAHLRSDGNKLNPGTTADLIAASLFAALCDGQLSPDAEFGCDLNRPAVNRMEENGRKP
jgi:triphosphoribosyl-dephospho-CoA synthase